MATAKATTQLVWIHTCSGGAYSECGRYVITCLDSGFYLLRCNAGGQRVLCTSMYMAMGKARRAAAGRSTFSN